MTSLRTQINLRITAISLIILLLGGMLAVWQASGSVGREVQSSQNLAAQLIYLLPTADNISDLTNALKEYLGIVIYRLRGWL